MGGSFSVWLWYGDWIAVFGVPQFAGIIILAVGVVDGAIIGFARMLDWMLPKADATGCDRR